MTDSNVYVESICSDELLSRIETLTAREHEVLNLILDGLSNDQIAMTLVRSPKTIDKHAQHIYRKLGINRRVHLVRMCTECGYSGGQHAVSSAGAATRSSTVGPTDDSYQLVQRLMRKGRAWDLLMELERLLEGVSGPRYFGEFVRTLTRVFGVKYAGITEIRPGDTHGVVLAFSIDGELVPEMDEYTVEGTPCQKTLEESSYIVHKDACKVFDCDEYLTRASIDSYAGVRLDDRMIGTLGLIWIADTQPMTEEGMHLDLLNQIAPSIAAELAVQVALDQAGEP